MGMNHPGITQHSVGMQPSSGRLSSAPVIRPQPKPVPLTISKPSVKLVPIHRGAYEILVDVAGDIPAGARFSLELVKSAGHSSNGTNTLSQSICVLPRLCRRDKAVQTFSLIDASSISALLRMINSLQCWGRPVQARVGIYKEHEWLAYSEPSINFNTPVEPVSISDEGLAGDKKLYYPWRWAERKIPADPKHPKGKTKTERYRRPAGRLLTSGKPATNLLTGKKFFFYFDHHEKHISPFLETDNTKRGFDCTTFVMTVLDLDARDVKNGKYGSDVAAAAGFVPVKPEGVTNPPLLSRKQLGEVLRDNDDQDFLIVRHHSRDYGKGDHVVFYRSGFVYEFTANIHGAKNDEDLKPPKSGGKISNIEKWHAGDVVQFYSVYTEPCQ